MDSCRASSLRAGCEYSDSIGAMARSSPASKRATYVGSWPNPSSDSTANAMSGIAARSRRAASSPTSTGIGSCSTTRSALRS